MSRHSDTSIDNLAFPPVTEQARLRLFQQVSVAAALVVLALWWTAENAHDWAFVLGTAICVLSMVPALLWTRTMRYNYPVFEIFIATNLTSYGIPLLSEHDAVLLFDERTRQDAALGVIVFLIAATAAFYAIRLPPHPAPWKGRSALQRPNKQWLLRGLVVTTLYTIVVPWLWAPPPGVEGILRAVMFGIGMTCTFIAALAWGLGRLRRGEKALVVICLVAQFVLLSATLVLRAGTSIVLLAIVGFFFGSRRIPFVALVIVLPVLAVLNIGKYDMRVAYWTPDSHEQPSPEGIPAFYGQWIRAGLHPQEQRTGTAGKLLLERNSLLQILCLVVDRTPDYLPYLDGKTYAQIPGTVRAAHLLAGQAARAH